MIYLFLSICSSVIVFILFKTMRQLGASTRHAIAINYLIAAATGFLFFDHDPEFWKEEWFIPAAIEGIFFYIVFRIIAKTTQTSGVAAASVATKMSLIIPVIIGVALLGETFSFIKLAGIFFGLLAVLLSSKSSEGWSNMLWPLLAFICSGFIDASLKLFQVWTVDESEYPSFVTVIFGFAFIAGIIHHFTFSDKSINIRSTIGGIMLGIVNFGSILFLLLALNTPNWESSMVIPVNNIGVVFLSSLLAIVLFKERARLKEYSGLASALASILLLYFSQ